MKKSDIQKVVKYLKSNDFLNTITLSGVVSHYKSRVLIIKQNPYQSRNEQVNDYWVQNLKTGHKYVVGAHHLKKNIAND